MSKGKLCGWRKKLRNLTTGTCFSWNGNSENKENLHRTWENCMK